MSVIGNTIVFDTNLDELKRDVYHLVEAGASEEDINKAINTWADTLDVQEIDNPYTYDRDFRTECR